MIEYFCKNCHRVFISKNKKCCGDVEIFSPEQHGRDLIGSSNSWISVWNQWKDDPLFQQVSQELCDRGCYGAATQLNEFIYRVRTELRRRRNESDEVSGVE